MQKNKIAIKLVFILALVLALIVPSTPVFFTPVQADEQLVYLSLGDDLVIGYSIGINTVVPYSTLLYQQFQSQHGSAIHFSEGVEGFLSDELLTRLDNTDLQNRIAMADQIVLSIGWQDIYSVITKNYTAYTTSAMSEANFRELLLAATENFITSFPQIVSRLELMTKSNTKIALMTLFNPFRAITNRSLGSIANEYFNMINTSIRNVESEKTELIDMKPLFDALNLTQHSALFGGTAPNLLLNADGHAMIYGQFIANLQVFDPDFEFLINLQHEGNLKQTYSQETNVDFTLQLYDVSLIGSTISWYVNGVLSAYGLNNQFSYLPAEQGVFEVRAVLNGYEAITKITVTYLEIDYISLDFTGLLYQELEHLQPITFFIDIPTADPSVLIVWKVDDEIVEASPNLYFEYTPSAVGDFVVRVERGTLFSQKTVRVVYSPVSDFILDVSGNLSQTLGSTNMVQFNVVLPTYCDPFTTVQWFLGGELQAETSQQFAFTPHQIGSYEVRAKIGLVEKEKDVVVEYATITNFNFLVQGNLNQLLNYITAVQFSFSLPEFTDPNTLAQWSVNSVRRATLSGTFTYTPTSVGSYVIEAKIGSVVKSHTITLSYLPIELEGKALSYNGSLTQYTRDMQPILFSIDISQFSNPSEVSWYVNGERMQILGKEFWFQPSSPPVGSDKIYYLVEARLDNGERSHTLIVSVFVGGTSSIDFYGILFLVVAAFAVIILVYYIYQRIRNRNLVI